MVGVILGLCVMTRRASLLFADVIGLWKISAAQMDDGMIGEEDLPTDFHTFNTAKETDRSKSEGGRD